MNACLSADRELWMNGIMDSLIIKLCGSFELSQSLSTIPILHCSNNPTLQSMCFCPDRSVVADVKNPDYFGEILGKLTHG